MENKIKCLRWGNEEVWKAGKPRGKQQYKSKACKKKFITELNYTKEFKQKAAFLNFHTSNKIPRHKQQKRLLDHLQILRIAVGFSGKFRKIEAQQPVHVLDGGHC